MYVSDTAIYRYSHYMRKKNFHFCDKPQFEMPNIVSVSFSKSGEGGGGGEEEENPREFALVCDGRRESAESYASSPPPPPSLALSAINWLDVASVQALTANLTPV